MAFKIKKRCIRCRKELRSDGTCQNKSCVRYKAEKHTETKDSTTTETK